MRLLRRFNTLFAAILSTIGLAVAQTPPANNPRSVISMDDAVRIAFAYYQTLRAQRLNIDQN